jgi:hypothetical protein
MHGSSSLLKVHELLALLPYHTCGDVVGAESIVKLSPRHLVIRGASDGVVGPPHTGVTPQLLCGEEGLLHLGSAQEPELGLHHSKPVVGLQRLSCLGEERRVRSRKVAVGGQSWSWSISCPHCHHGWSWQRAGAATRSARRGAQGSRRSLEPNLAVEARSCSLGSSRSHSVRCECSPICHPNMLPLA